MEERIITRRFDKEGIVSLKVTLQLGMLRMVIWEKSIYYYVCVIFLRKKMSIFIKLKMRIENFNELGQIFSSKIGKFANQMPY